MHPEASNADRDYAIPRSVLNPTKAKDWMMINPGLGMPKGIVPPILSSVGKRNAGDERFY